MDGTYYLDDDGQLSKPEWEWEPADGNLYILDLDTHKIDIIEKDKLSINKACNSLAWDYLTQLKYKTPERDNEGAFEIRDRNALGFIGKTLYQAKWQFIFYIYDAIVPRYYDKIAELYKLVNELDSKYEMEN